MYLSTDKNVIYRIENDYSLTYITTAIYPKTLTDIAISTSGSMYGIASEDLVEINLQNGEVQFLDQLPGYDISNSLTCSYDDKLYFRGRFSNVLYSYDLSNHSFRLINYLDEDQTYDVTFYKGNILLQSLYKYEIDAYDIQEQLFNKMACMDHAGIEGLSSVMDSCGAEHVYAIDDGSRFFEINFDDHQLHQLFNFWTPDRKFLGMASVSENLGSTCYSYLSPVECEYIAALDEIQINPSVQVFPNPAKSYFTIECDAEIEGLKIFNTSGVLVKSLNGSVHEVDVQDLISGIYVLQIFSNHTITYQKIALQ